MTERSGARLLVLKVTVLALLLTLGGRIWYLQVLSGQQYSVAAADNNRRDIVEPGTRGRILDIQGRPLVQNRTALVVSVDRVALQRQPHHGADVLARLAKVIRIPLTTLRDRVSLCTFVDGPSGRKVAEPDGCWNGSPYQPIQVTDGADAAMAQQIEERQEMFPGVTARPTAVRDYPAPLGVNAAHLLGYLSPVTQAELDTQKHGGGDVVLDGTELVGRAGLESVYDKDLRGNPSTTTVAVDAHGAVTGIVRQQPGAGGSTLVTSLDAGVQRVAEQALVHGIAHARSLSDRDGRHYKADSAAAVVLDVQTGRVVALASYPTYNPKVWVGGISRRDYSALLDARAGVPLIFRPTQGGFAPGSTFKVVSLAAAVDDGYPLGAAYPCPSTYTVGNRPFHNFESESLGTISLHTAIVKSCDTIFYKFGYEEWLRDERGHPREVFVAMAKRFGLGAKTGIDMPDERSGRIASRAFKKLEWSQLKGDYCKGAQNPAFDSEHRRADREFCLDGYRYRGGDAVNFAIGQGDTIVTPLQLADTYAAIANGGTLYEPQIGRAVVGPDGRTVRDLAPVVRGRLGVSPALLGYERDALAGVTTEGTAKDVFKGFPEQWHVAGKTGTAQVAGKQDTSWFASFAPASHPRFAVVVMITQGGQGAQSAAPAVREIYSGIFGADKQRAALPGGALPVGLPRIAPDGSVVAPQPAIVPTPSSSPSPTPAALEDPALPVERRWRLPA